MMSCDLEGNFPLTYSKMKDLYYGKELFNEVGRFILPNKYVKKTKVELEQDFMDHLSMVQQPIWNLCESVLKGNYITSSGSDSYTTVGGICFKHTTCWPQYSQLEVEPDITYTEEESTLWTKVLFLTKTSPPEIKSVYRDKLLAYYKEESK